MPLLPSVRSSPVAALLLIWLLAAGTLLIAFGQGETAFELLRSSDDHMRFVRIQAWLEGAGWYDDTLTRLNPPDGTVMIWSRLPDLPVAGVILLLSPLLGPSLAEMLAVAGVPLLLVGALLGALTWTARSLIPAVHAPAAALVLLTTPALIQFVPGRIDHHVWVQIAAALGLSVLLGAGARTPGTRPAMLGGAALGVGLVISLETLFAILPIQLGLVVLWLTGWPYVRHRALVWSGSMLAAVLLLWPISTAHASLFSVVCDRFSVVYVAAVAALPLFWTVVGYRLIAGTRLAGRLAPAGSAAALILAALWLAFPGCRGGPMSQIPDDQGPLWLEHVSEMQPLWRHEVSTVVYQLTLAGAALATALLRAIRAGPSRPVWLAYATAITLGVLFTLTVLRAHSVMHIIGAVALGSLLSSLWQVADRYRHPARRGFVSIAGSLVVFLTPVTLAALANLPRPDVSSTGCERTHLPDLLTNAPVSTPQLIAAPLFSGPFVLTGSGHDVLAAPYHRNVGGNRLLGRIFQASSASDARRAIGTAGVDLVLICERSQLLSGPFVERLRQGQPPPWLTRLDGPGAHGYRLYAVTPEHVSDVDWTPARRPTAQAWGASNGP